MSEELIKFDSSNQLPAEYKEQFEAESRDNLTGVQPRLPKAKMPTGRGKLFTLEGAGETRDIPELRGVIIYQSPAKAYWKEAFGGGSTSVVPDCASHDGIKPSDQYSDKQADVCASCKHNRFGTAKDGAGNKLPGKACRDVKRVVILLTDDPEIPYLLTVPPTGIRNFDDYLIRLRKERRPYWSVVSELKLITDSNKKGIEYPKVTPNIMGFINDPKTLDKIKAIKVQWAELLKTTLFENTDVGTPIEETEVESRVSAPTGPEEF